MSPSPLPADHLTTLDDATRLFASALADPLDGDCDACPGWTRRDVANHVLGGGLRYAAYFPRLPESEIGWTRTADHAGAKPVPALYRTAAGLRRELAKAPDADALVAHRMAEIPVRDLLALRVFELVVHAHDLSPRTWDSPEAEALAGWALDHARDVVELMRTFDVFAEARPVAIGADARARLSALSGRSPEWSRG
ncbi:maleylpyruvate isomerase N-terminal domain-containing protein [Rhodococcus sp. IEGM 1408]|uniref:maleylpyruvate isomerase N-terminal domain-containing protein n=1 Tax=Rhodococcus sp. IEGM 1408 TaxID=3082220 RepID=UPI002954C251|nr:maleylpyruvate isomerase N-terminal domain-containing protein [Rhodococcus sp. IEGM 1408]MDV7999830.1 maleylpyruvate isomerase N-terminal domain-containing protein [Rhodococcus sp. IEGM 1408]